MNGLPWAYFDTSALVKRYVREKGTLEVRRLLRIYRVLSSSMMPIELFSALTRRYGQKELSGRNYTAILFRIKQDRNFWELVEVTPSVLARAEEIVLNLRVRTLDAIHLASAAIVRDSTGRSLPFVTSDERQLDGARKYGLEVIQVTG
ncbi:MAG: type II toxin-antitoxin system VapC family toxin [Candidatus Binatia bacterium]